MAVERGKDSVLPLSRGLVGRLLGSQIAARTSARFGRRRRANAASVLAINGFGEDVWMLRQAYWNLELTSCNTMKR